MAPGLNKQSMASFSAPPCWTIASTKVTSPFGRSPGIKTLSRRERAPVDAYPRKPHTDALMKLRRLLYEALIVPSAHTRVFDAKFQLEVYEVFHTHGGTRWVHLLC